MSFRIGYEEFRGTNKRGGEVKHSYTNLFKVGGAVGTRPFHT